MRNLFFGILFAVASVCSGISPAFAEGSGQGECTVANAPACEAYHSDGSGLKPAVPDMVCFTFTQKKPDFVVFTLYDVVVNYDDLSDPANHVLRTIKHDNPDGTTGQFCVGRQYVEKAVFVSLCNQFDAHSNRDLSDLQEGLSTGKVEMCLNGDETCPRFVR
jgi:hypothetical protein